MSYYFYVLFCYFFDANGTRRLPATRKEDQGREWSVLEVFARVIVPLLEMAGEKTRRD